MPDSCGHAPSWGTRPFPQGDRAGRLVPLASGIPGDEDALPIHSNARVLGGFIKARETVSYPVSRDRHLYLVPATGRVRIGEVEATARDGVAITDVESLKLTALEDSEVVLVDAA